MKNSIHHFILSVFDIDYDAKRIVDWLESTLSVSLNYYRYASWEFIALFINFSIFPVILSIFARSVNHIIIVPILSFMSFFICMDLFLSIVKYTKISIKQDIFWVHIINGLKDYLSVFFLSINIVALFFNFNSLNDNISSIIDIILALILLGVTCCNCPSTNKIFKNNLNSFKRPSGLKLFMIRILEINFTIFCTIIFVVGMLISIRIGAKIVIIIFNYV